MPDDHEEGHGNARQYFDRHRRSGHRHAHDIRHQPRCGTPAPSGLRYARRAFSRPSQTHAHTRRPKPQGEHHGGQVAAVPVAQRDSGPLPRTGSTRSTPAQPIPPVSIASDPTNPSNTGSDRRQDPFPVGAEAAARWGHGPSPDRLLASEFLFCPTPAARRSITALSTEWRTPMLSCRSRIRR